ncbi:GerMN domain-containing protein [Desulfobacula sp.]|uniref:GerMN domain-containing protein n=1 Tax=Desulfobacula sp. TaxID=2593537 RepID=UPI00260ED645|nr:GerMN domain-containing protein [Desulfobacula sp.]
MKSEQKRRIVLIVFLIFFMLLSICVAGNDMVAKPMPAYEDLFEGFVYYADKQKTALKSVKIRFAATLDSHQLGREIIKTLIAGPSLPSLEPTWPADATINSFFITDEGAAYVDLNLKQGRLDNMDTQSELLALYSMVNSLTLNIPKIKRVKLLIQGKDAMTLAGHIDLEYFYQTNMLIVK